MSTDTASPPPKFAPHQRVVVAAGDSPWAGEILGPGGGPGPHPWWEVREDDGRKWVIPESSISPADPPPRFAPGSRVRVTAGPRTGRVGEVVALDTRLGPGFRTVKLDGLPVLIVPDEELEAFPGPGPEREADPPPKFAPGQRVVVACEDVPREARILRPQEVAGGGRWWRVLFDGESGEYCIREERIGPAPGPPIELPSHVAAIASGAALWQQRDPRNRSVFVHVFGHVATVTATATPAGDGHTAKFLGPLRESAVGPALDLVIANGDHQPVAIGGTDPLEAP